MRGKKIEIFDIYFAITWAPQPEVDTLLDTPSKLHPQVWGVFDIRKESRDLSITSWRSLYIRND
jgi:hypothetical protein